MIILYRTQTEYVLVSNYFFPIPLSLKPNGVYLLFFNLLIMSTASQDLKLGIYNNTKISKIKVTNIGRHKIQKAFEKYITTKLF